MMRSLQANHKMKPFKLPLFNSLLAPTSGSPPPAAAAAAAPPSPAGLRRTGAGLVSVATAGQA